MTREEAKKYCESKYTFLAISDVFVVIDKIHDDFEQQTIDIIIEAVNRGYSKAVADFESRTCSTCSYCSGEYCDLLDTGLVSIVNQSCNGWENKGVDNV